MPSPRSFRPALVVAVALAAVGGGWLYERAIGSEPAAGFPVVAWTRWSAAMELPSSRDEAVAVESAALPVAFSLERGDTLSRALLRLGLESAEAYAACEAVGGLADLRKLRAGDPATAFYEGTHLASFDLSVRDEGRLRVERGAGGWKAAWNEFEHLLRRDVAEGVLEDSLEAALHEAGAPVAVAYQMADVLQWDLDFNRDLQPGDRFRVLYETALVEGRPSGLGKIQALVYTTRGRTLEAYRFEDQGYYDAGGRPLRKLFLRSPLPYSRVTSRFTARRFHPILKTYRPHWGVDFGAPTGTPVRVTASGVVTFAGWDDGGGGKTIKVRHPNGYITAYLHLSGFAKGGRSGARVEQGEVVGYVGSTGLATASHLDYRVKKGGRWIDPLSLTPEPAPPIAPERMSEFSAVRNEQRVALSLPPLLLDPPASPSLGDPTRLAAAGSSEPLATAVGR